MDKNGLERAVPLLPPLIKAFQDYEVSDKPEQPLFTRYGNTRGFDSISTALRAVIRQKLQISDPTLVPYSARHTLVDRARASRTVPLSHVEYVVGHKSEGSSGMHRRYGTMTPPRVILDDLTEIFEIKDWGYYDD